MKHTLEIKNSVLEEIHNSYFHYQDMFKFVCCASISLKSW